MNTFKVGDLVMLAEDVVALRIYAAADLMTRAKGKPLTVVALGDINAVKVRFGNVEFWLYEHEYEPYVAPEPAPEPSPLVNYSNAAKDLLTDDELSLLDRIRDDENPIRYGDLVEQYRQYYVILMSFGLVENKRHIELTKLGKLVAQDKATNLPLSEHEKNTTAELVDGQWHWAIPVQGIRALLRRKFIESRENAVGKDFRLTAAGTAYLELFPDLLLSDEDKLRRENGILTDQRDAMVTELAAMKAENARLWAAYNKVAEAVRQLTDYSAWDSGFYAEGKRVVQTRHLNALEEIFATPPDDVKGHDNV